MSKKTLQEQIEELKAEKERQAHEKSKEQPHKEETEEKHKKGKK